MNNDVFIIGAGPAGLATARCLVRQGVPVQVIEGAADFGASWRSHYERLHLHTVKQHPALPGMPFPRDYPRYVSRQQMVDYLAAYARRLGIRPDFGQQVARITAAGTGWNVVTVAGNAYLAARVVVATGAKPLLCRLRHPLPGRSAAQDWPAGANRRQRDPGPARKRGVIVASSPDPGSAMRQQRHTVCFEAHAAAGASR